MPRRKSCRSDRIVRKFPKPLDPALKMPLPSLTRTEMRNNMEEFLPKSHPDRLLAEDNDLAYLTPLTSPLLSPLPVPLLMSSAKQSVTSRLNHSFRDQPYRKAEPLSSQSQEPCSSSMSSLPISMPKSSIDVTYPTSVLDMNSPLLDTAISRDSSDSVHKKPSSPASSFCPDRSRLYIANLPETLEELFFTAKSTDRGRKRAASPVSPTSNTPSPSLLSGTSQKYLRLSRSKDAFTQTSRTEPDHSTSLKNAPRNMDLLCPSPNSQQLIESDLAQPRCCLCGAPQAWEKLAHFKQCVRDWLSDITLNAPEIDGLTAMTDNPSFSLMNSVTVPSLVVNGTHFVIPVHQFWRLRDLSSLISQHTTSYWRIGGPTTSTNGLRLKCLPSGTLTVAD